MTIKSLVVVFSFLFSGLWGFSQTPDKEQPVKVGLVLSGGGAKGLAHIGVLKVIEEAGVTIDYIAGSSMGAIVGALYASGYSAKELDSLFKTTNFVELIQDESPRSAKTFYEKENSERYALSLPFNNFKVSFPQALSGGQNVYNELVRLLFHVKDIRDFNQLPIPFLCMATNMETGEEIVLDKGYLPEALMASGALPSLFVPSEIDGVVLIDGGIVNNYPTDKIKDRGATLIIGVDVQNDLATRESLTSATEILIQINKYRAVSDMKKKMKVTDIYIRPDIKDFSLIDFNRGETIIARGEAAAQTKIEELQHLAQRQKASPLPPKRIQIQENFVLSQLIIKGNNQYTRGYIKGKLRVKLAEKTTFENLQQGINNLYATGNFKTIRYQLVSNRSGGTDLILILQENPDKMFLKVAAHYDDLYKSAVLFNLTKKNALLKDDVASFDFILGDHIRYNAQYHVDKGYYWSFGLNSKLTNFDEAVDFGLIRSGFNIPDNPNIRKINLDVVDLTNQFYLQTVLQEEFAFIIGLEHKFLQYSTQTLNQIEEEEVMSASGAAGRTFFENSNYVSAYGKMVLDTYDNKYFPTRGLFFDGNFHLYLFSSDFNDNFSEFSIGKAKIGVVFPLLHNLSLSIVNEGGFTIGGSAVKSFDFVLGGYGNDFVNNFTPFLGYDFLSLPGNSFVKAQGRLDYQFAPKHHALFSANFANVEDNIFQTGEWFSAPNFTGYGIGYGCESFLGPLQVYYSWSPEIDGKNVFFSIGYWF